MRNNIDKEAKLIQARLKEVLNYNEETGIFTRLAIATNRLKNDKIAGSLNNTTGYGSIMIDGNLFYAHRLAWLYIYGEWPQYTIDHKNGIRDDNRICNLQDIPHSDNQKNLARSTRNTSGTLGVSYYKTNGKWRSQVMVGNKNKHLGYFKDLRDAVVARKQADIKYNYSPLHGRRV